MTEGGRKSDRLGTWEKKIEVGGKCGNWTKWNGWLAPV